MKQVVDPIEQCSHHIAATHYRCRDDNGDDDDDDDQRIPGYHIFLVFVFTVGWLSRTPSKHISHKWHFLSLALSSTRCYINVLYYTYTTMSKVYKEDEISIRVDRCLYDSLIKFGKHDFLRRSTSLVDDLTCEQSWRSDWYHRVSRVRPETHIGSVDIMYKEFRPTFNGCISAGFCPPAILNIFCLSDSYMFLWFTYRHVPRFRLLSIRNLCRQDK